MKNLIPLFLIALLIACNAKQEETAVTTDPTEEQAEKVTTYGAEVNTNEAVPVSEILPKLEGKDSLFVTVKGEITSTCKMKGCWMKVDMPEGEDMRVSFKDYGFFVPKEGMEGKTAIFEGWVTKSLVSEEDRRHFVEDAGKSQDEINAIVGDEEQLAFVAKGVVIEE